MACHLAARRTQRDLVRCERAGPPPWLVRRPGRGGRLECDPDWIFDSVGSGWVTRGRSAHERNWRRQWSATPGAVSRGCPTHTGLFLYRRGLGHLLIEFLDVPATDQCALF